MEKISNPYFVEERERFLIRTDFYGFFSKLSREERGDLIMAIFEYHKFGEVKTPLTDRTRWSFDYIQGVLDDYSTAYIKKAEISRKNGAYGGRPKKTQETQENPLGFKKTNKTQETQENPKNLDIDIVIDNDIDNDIDCGIRETKRKRFSPPTLEEVKAYCLERENNVNAERFIDHYTSNGWKVGKNSMMDWKSAIRQWERNEYSKGVIANDKYVGDNESHNKENYGIQF